ncbi:MAG: Gfo/Idh/MocA family oxidoreductase [Candidatus Bathyarchaeota archaeon]|nr:MAG: Gfo/Idh/MocA family oxidoreductase [Candidatus Bathyarchaeota archaeon]
MNVPLCVAVVGCGQIAEVHVNAWRHAGAKVMAVCDKNTSLAESKAKKWNIPHFYEDVSQLIKEEKIDFASICTPATVRLSIVEPLMANGIHVVIEKPFAMSVTEAEKMVELKNKYDVRLSVVHNWLFSHIMKKTLNILEKKKIGEILGFEMDLSHTKEDSMAADSAHWCHSLEAGRFGEMLPHPIYVTLAILGEVKVKHVLGSKLGSYPWMPIDELHILLQDETNRLASIYVSFNTARQETTLKIFGTTGVLEVNLSNNILIKKHYREIKNADIIKDNLRLIKDHMTSSFSIGKAILTKQYQSMHTNFIKDFVNSLKNNMEPPVTAEEALEVVKLHTDLCSSIHELYFSD